MQSIKINKNVCEGHPIYVGKTILSKEIVFQWAYKTYNSSSDK